MRFKLRIKDLAIFCLVAKMQQLEGITNKLTKNEYVIFWDLEKCTLKQCREALLYVQTKYDLSHIGIISDKPNSYRAICMKIVNFKKLLHILIDTDYLDPQFLLWTINRGKSTIRMSNKKGRDKQKLIEVLKSYSVINPYITRNKIEKVNYETLKNKRQLSIKIVD